MELSTLLPIILTVAAVVASMALVALLAKNYKKIPPNQVAVSTITTRTTAE